MKFSAIFQPTTLFSLKDSNSTNKGATSLLLPSPYAIKMAILNQAITVGGELLKLEKKDSKEFGYVRDTKISFYLPERISFCVNNSFVRIIEQKEDKRGKKEKEAGQIFTPGFKPTISFREYVFISDKIEIIFDVESEVQKDYLKQYLYRINYFGKRGCFFQFIEFKEDVNEANVIPFDVKNGLAGILQSYDDFDSNVSFENVNNFSNTSTKRKTRILVLPLKTESSSKSFTQLRNN
jgi:CRISPR-associated protein Cas5 subtype I-A